MRARPLRRRRCGLHQLQPPVLGPQRFLVFYKLRIHRNTGHRAHLHALPAFDAGTQKIFFVQCTRWSQPLLLCIGQRQITRQGSAEHATGKQRRPHPSTPILPRHFRSRGFCRTVRLGRFAIGHPRTQLGLTNFGTASLSVNSGDEKGARRSRKSSNSITGAVLKKRAMGSSIQIWSA